MALSVVGEKMISMALNIFQIDPSPKSNAAERDVVWGQWSRAQESNSEAAYVEVTDSDQLDAA